MIRATTSSSSISSRNAVLPVGAVLAGPAPAVVLPASLDDDGTEGPSAWVDPPNPNVAAAVDPNDREFELRNEGKRFLMAVELV
jgi:hypothetical protein